MFDGEQPYYMCRYDQWEQFNKEIEELNLSVLNFTVSEICLRNK